MSELDQAWKEKQPDWARQRLMVLRLVARHEHSAEEIGEMVGIGRASVFNYLKAYLKGGLDALLKRGYCGGRKPALKGAVRQEFMEELRKGKFRRAKEAQAWVLKKTGQRLGLQGIYYWLGKVGGVLKMPRKTHVRKNAAEGEAFRREAGDRLAQLCAAETSGKVRVWVADEHRYGLLPVIRRCWGLKGIRVHAPYATKYQWGYIYEALEVDGQNKMEMLFVPRVGKDVSNIFLQQISAVDPDALHLVLWDQAGFHPRDGEEGLPSNVRLLSLPAYSPELNPVEKLGDLVKDAICNKLFTQLRPLEDAILSELEPLRQSGQRVAQLLGSSYLVSEVNA